MASKIVLKKSSVAGKIPTTEDLEYGELAINYADKKLYFKTATNEIDYLSRTDNLLSTVFDRQQYIVTTPGTNTFSIAYEPGFIDVYVNGVKLNPSEYTATNGASVTIAGLVVDDEVQLIGVREAFEPITFDEAYNRQTYTATSGQTTFAIVYDVVGSKSYVQVYVNGVLIDASEYTATSGTDVVLTTPCIAGDIVELIGFSNINVADLLKYSLKTANYTLNPKEGIITDTSGGSFTVSLPASPTIGDQVFIADTGNWGTNPLTVDRNGSTIEGNADNLSLDLNNALVQFLYDGTTWQVFSQIGGDASGFLKLSGGTMTGNITFAAGQTWPTFNQNTTGNAATATTATNVSGGTASVTTLTTSSTVTHNGGTANGVAYLNGSKVLTTGSALTFDGAEIFRNSGGTIQYNDVRGSAAAGTRLSAGGTLGTDSFDLFQNSAAGYVYNRANTPLIFGVNNAEQMRLTSTGLGIGTSSPSAIASGYATVHTAGANGGGIKFGTSSTLTIGYAAGSSSGVEIGTSGSTPLTLFTNNVTRATLDSSGNLGLGVTPSAWSSQAKALEIGIYAGFYRNASGLTAVSFNSYQNTSNIDTYRVSANPATKYEMGGGHAWYTAPSGTAGNAISFTQAMTLDSSGNLLVGTTSQSYSNTQMTVYQNVSSGNAIEGNFAGNGGIGYLGVYRDASGTANFGYFIYNASLVGSITSSGSSTAYNTSSDYRLKNITGPVTNSGAYIDSLKPVEGTWKADGSTFVGLIAHEVQEVSRTQVATGEKDGEQMQGMDYSNSEFIANIIAELQSLRKRVAELESKA